MGAHLHKRFLQSEVISILKKYLNKEIKSEHAISMLDISRTQFFEVFKRYKENPKDFSLDYKRKSINRKISEISDKKILQELKKEKKILEDKSNPVRDYNYSYIKNILEEKHSLEVSLPTIINRAKKMGFTKERRSRNDMIEKF